MELSIDTDIYVVSDLHINHRKLCTGYEDHFERTRKYTTVVEMDEDIVAQWNKTIPMDSVVIFLGDFMMNTPTWQMESLFTEFTGMLNFSHLYMLRGNHDHVLFERLRNVKVSLTAMTFIDDYIMLTHRGKKYLMQHYNFDGQGGNPVILNRYLQNGITPDYLVHGHTHDSEQTGTVNNLITNNVCWEAWYRPVRLDELVPAIQETI